MSPIPTKLSLIFPAIVLFSIALPIFSEKNNSHSEIEFPKEILSSFENYDVLIIGEEHNNTAGHKTTLSIIESIARDRPIAISLEMLEWHQQESIDEYLRNEIPLNQMLNHTVFWKNFRTDYLPIVNFAKKNNIHVIAANPPRKYVNKVSREGMNAYFNLNPNARKSMPLPQNVLRDRSVDYETRLKELFLSMHSMDPNHIKDPVDKNKILSGIENMILAQHIWDAGMAEKILEDHYYRRKKIIHLNGRFHSDYGLGVAYRLKKAGLRVLTVSIIPESGAKKENITRQSGIADFLILTK